MSSQTNKTLRNNDKEYVIIDNEIKYNDVKLVTNLKDKTVPFSKHTKIMYNRNQYKSNHGK